MLLQQSFPEDYKLLAAGKAVSSKSRLLTLLPELDRSSGLVRVGGRLQRSEGLSDSRLHPVVLDPSHSLTQLLIQKYDSDLHHPGLEWVYAEMRRSFWIIRGRSHSQAPAFLLTLESLAIHPQNGRSTSSPPSITQASIYSMGVDCFCPMLVKVARRHEKCWGIIFKCLTTRAIHLDLSRSVDADTYLMALRRFIARHGTPSDLWSDQGTNFKGGDRELQEAFAKMAPTLQEQLARQRIKL